MFPYINPTIFHSYSIDNSLIISWLIKVPKLYQIIISSSDLSHFYVFDGPGFIFPVINSSMKFIVTSTFQCIVQQLIKQNNTEEMKQLSFVAKSRKSISYLHIRDNYTFLNFTGDCLSLVCVTHILTEDGYQINFTIYDLFHNNPLNFGCLFWGMVVVEEFNNTFQESVIMCEQFHEFNYTTLASRSFYSLNSSLFLIIYNYEAFINNSVIGSISKTKCKPFHLDPCEVVHHFCDSVKAAQMYISSINKLSDLSLYVNDFLPIFNTAKATVDLLFNLTDNSCVVIQIGNKNQKERLLKYEQVERCFFYAHFCQIFISPRARDNFITSVKGDLKIPLYNNLFTKAAVFYMPEGDCRSSRAKLRKKKFERYKSFSPIKQLGLISAVDISLERRSTQWMEIILRNSKNMQSCNALNFSYQLKYANLFDIIASYGPALFSNLDVNVRLLKNNLNSVLLPESLNMTLKIVFGHALFLPKIVTILSKFRQIV